MAVHDEPWGAGASEGGHGRRRRTSIDDLLLVPPPRVSPLARLVSGSRDGLILIWEPVGWTCERRLQDTDRVACLALIGGNKLVSGGSSSDTNDTIRVWDCPATFAASVEGGGIGRAVGGSGGGAGITDGGNGAHGGLGFGTAGPGGSAAEAGVNDRELGDGGGGDWSYEKSVEAGNGQAVATIISHGRTLLVGHFSEDGNESERQGAGGVHRWPPPGHPSPTLTHCCRPSSDSLPPNSQTQRSPFGGSGDRGGEWVAAPSSVRVTV